MGGTTARDRLPTDAFRAIADLLPQGMLLLSSDGTVLAANRSLGRQLGVPPRELEGVALAEVVVKNPGGLSRYLESCAASREPVLGSLVLPGPDGKELAFRAEGLLLEQRPEGADGAIVLRLIPRRAPIKRFTALNAKIAELTREITWRKHAEEYRTRLLEHEQLARQRADFLAEAGAVLSASLDYRATLSQLARLAVPVLADWCLIDMVSDTGEVQRVEVAHADPEMADLAVELRRFPPQRESAGHPAAGALFTGRTVLIREVTPEIVLRTCRSDEHRLAARELDPRSCISVPLTARGQVLGALSFIATPESGRIYGPEDVQLAEELARRASLALENARLHKALQEQTEALRQADQRKDEFLAMLAHELRNPLAPIRNACRILRMVRTDDANHGWATKIIDRQLAHLARVVDDLLDISRITRGKVRLRRESLDLSAIVSQTAEAFRGEVEARSQELTVSLPPEPIPIHGDSARLGQVLGNLLSNASKYNHDGGRIWVSAIFEGPEAVLRVRDEGIGIDREFLPRAFDLFSQGERSLARSESGLGIGLALVRTLVELHGGTVSGRSDGQGKGSEFVVRLPLATAAEATPGEKPAGGEPARAEPVPASCRVLVVDDNKDSTDTLAMLVEAWGHEARVAYDGPSAVETALTYRPQVVLLDIGLPGMSGFDVAKRLRANPGLDGTLLVALSGYGQEEDRRRSREAGLDHHLIKPVDTTKLEALLASAAGDGTDGGSRTAGTP